MYGSIICYASLGRITYDATSSQVLFCRYYLARLKAEQRTIDLCGGSPYEGSPHEEMIEFHRIALDVYQRNT